MNYFLAKTEPSTYSLEDLERDRRTVWDGVTNAQAVRAIREMRPGDRVFIYHSGGVSAVVGIALVLSAGRPEKRTARNVSAAATRSRAECAASARIPKLPVQMPTTILKAVSPTAATSERSAADCFSPTESVTRNPD